MKHALPALIAVAAVALMSPAGAQDKPEMPKVRLAVGGKSAIFYLPLSITERLGYFRDAGLEVEIADVQSGARALQSLVGGTPEGTQAVYGGPYPGGVVYTTADFIAKNPRTVQALANAMVRGLKWIAGHSAAEIAAVMPEDYTLGNKPLYVQSIQSSLPMYSPDGRFSREAAETAATVLKAFDPDVARATIDIAATYTDAFADKASAAR